MFSLVLGVLQLSAQEDLRIEKIEGEKYIIHQVEPQQTLYAISRKYNVSVKEIVEANPSVDIENLKIDQVLRIPYTKSVKQDLKENKVKISGDTIYHTVLVQETLYSISKRYDISIDEIMAVNPSIAKDGLKAGATIVIPYKKTIAAIDPKELSEPTKDSLLLHEVKPKETLFSLSRQYEVTIDSIQMVNDGLKEGLKVGTTIRIPLRNPNYTTKPGKYGIPSILKDSTIILAEETDTTVVALLLPFYLDINDSLDTLKADYDKRQYKIYEASTYSLDFYQGFKVAIDSLRKQGRNFKVKVFDTSNDKKRIEDILKSGALNGVHVIIGPLYRSNFEYVADQLKDSAVTLVTPVKISSKILLGRSNVAKVEASEPAHIIGLARHVAEKYPSNRTFVVNTGRLKDKYNLELTQKYLNKNVVDSTDTTLVLNMFSITKDKFTAALKDSLPVAIVIPTDDQAYVSKAISTLYDLKLSLKRDNISVFGTEKWLDYDNLETEQLMALNVHVVAQHYEDYENDNVKNFLRKYRQNYAADPGKFGFLGFDVGYFFLQCGGNYGAGCVIKLPGIKDEMLTTSFDFVKVGAESGYENSAVYILEFDDYRLKRRAN